MLRTESALPCTLRLHELTRGCGNDPHRGADKDLLGKACVRHVRRPCDGQERDDGDGKDREVSGLDIVSDLASTR